MKAIKKELLINKGDDVSSFAHIPINIILREFIQENTKEVKVGKFKNADVYKWVSTKSYKAVLTIEEI